MTGLASVRLRDRRPENFTTDLTASAGISADLKTTDLLAKLLGAIGKGTVDQKLLDGLGADDAATLYYRCSKPEPIMRCRRRWISPFRNRRTGKRPFSMRFSNDLLDSASS